MADRFGRSAGDRLGRSKKDVVYGRRTQVRAGKTRFRTKSERYYNRNSSPLAAYKTDQYGRLVRAGNSKGYGFKYNKSKGGLSSMLKTLKEGGLKGLLKSKLIPKSRSKGQLSYYLKRMGVKTKLPDRKTMLKRLLKFKDPRKKFKIFNPDKKTKKRVPNAERTQSKRSKVKDSILRDLEEIRRAEARSKKGPKAGKTKSEARAKAEAPKARAKTSRKSGAASKGRKGRSLDDLVTSVSRKYAKAKAKVAKEQEKKGKKGKSGRGAVTGRAYDSARRSEAARKAWKTKRSKGAVGKGRKVI